MKVFTALVCANAVIAFQSRSLLSHGDVTSGNELSEKIYHLAPEGSAICDHGSRVDDADECELASARLVKQLPENVHDGSFRIGTATTPKRGLVQGHWNHVPRGCSAQTSGDYAAHLNSNGLPSSTSGYSLICSEPNPDHDTYWNAYDSSEPTYHLAPRGATECAFGKVVTDQTKCDQANNFLVANLGVQEEAPLRNVRNGSWDFTPYGCSTLESQNSEGMWDYTAHLNLKRTAVNEGKWRLICEGPIIRDRGYDPHNDQVSAAEVTSAALAAQAVYKLNTGECAGQKFGEWTCVKSEQKPYHYWFDDYVNEETKWRYLFFTAPENKCGFAFRGTSQLFEWHTNLNPSWEDPQNWMGEKVHNGFKQAFNGNKNTQCEYKDGAWTLFGYGNTPCNEYIGNRLVGAVSYWLNDDHWKQKCTGGVYFVGHSLGGAIATVADMWYEDTFGKKATSITFGAPMVVQESEAKKAYNELRIFHAHDPVASALGNTMTGIVGLEHRGPSKVIECDSGETGYMSCTRPRFEEGTEQSKGRIEYVTPYSWTLDSWLTLEGWTADAGYHNMDNYVRYAFAQVEQARQINEPCAQHVQCSTAFCRMGTMAAMQENYCADPFCFEGDNGGLAECTDAAVDTTVDILTTGYDATVDVVTTGYEVVKSYVTSWFGW